MSRRRMKEPKRALVPVTMLLAFALAWASGGFDSLQRALAIARNEPSRVVVNSVSFDFGTVPSGPELQTQFQLTNAGGRRLILHREDGGCPCLSMTPELTLAPGASCELAATLETEQLRGPIQTQICYRTNDPQFPVLKFTLLANVVTSSP